MVRSGERWGLIGDVGVCVHVCRGTMYTMGAGRTPDMSSFPCKRLIPDCRMVVC